MPSSTSSSERRWSAWLLAGVLPLLVSTLGVGAIHRTGGLMADPMVSQALLQPGAAPKLVVLGNSVAQSAISTEALTHDASLNPSDVAVLAAGGLQPAHWLAVLRHQVHGRGAAPEWAVVYAPAHSLGRVALVSKLDQALLLDLLVDPDEALVTRATGRSGGGWALLSRNRERARDRLLQVVGYTPAELWYGRGRAEPVVEPAMADLFSGRGPATAGPESLDLGLDDRAAEDVRQAQEATVPLAESWLPAIAAEALAHDGRLLVVLAAERGARCGATDPSELSALGVDVLDLRVAPLSPTDFAGDHHLRASGAQIVSELLAQDLASRAADADGSPRTRVIGCP